MNPPVPKRLCFITTYANRIDVIFTVAKITLANANGGHILTSTKPKRYNSYKKRGNYYGSKS